MRFTKSISIMLILAILCMTLSPFTKKANAEIIPYQPVKPLPILFVHGYDDKGCSWEESDFYNYVQTLGAKVVSVDYNQYSRNDITSTKINEIYTEAVNRLPKDTKFDIVVHSMGGLLTRYYLLQNEDVRKRVRRVIMIGTPNHGSPIALQNRISDMIDDPEDYWDGGLKNPAIMQYREYYSEFTDNLFDTYNGGKIEDQSYEYWLSIHHPEVTDSILQNQDLGEGGNLTDLGTKVLPGGLNYRYSKSFNIYAQVMTARSHEREDRQAKFDMISQGNFFMNPKEAYVVDNDGVSQEQQLTEHGWVDEGTKLKEIRQKSCTYTQVKNHAQPATAKNIVQDRLMLEQFELHYYDKNHQKRSRYVVSNLFLNWLWKEESSYREQALKKNTYFPQYITIATVDDPTHKLGRWLTDKFVKNMSAWPYEENDSVVPLKSVTLFNNGQDQLLDRNIKIIPDGSAKIRADRFALKRSGGYTFHGDQMAAIDLLRNEYNNPLTGVNDSEVLMDIVPDAVSPGNSSIVVAKPTNESLGNKYKLEIYADHQTTVRIMERDRNQMWSHAQEVTLLRGDYPGYKAEVHIKLNEKISDYLIVGKDKDLNLTVTVRSEEQTEGEDGKTAGSPGNYPYYIQPLDTTLEGGMVRQRFRVYDRTTDQAVKGLLTNDLIVKLNGKPLLHPRLSVASEKIESASNIMLALDYSSSMETIPRNYSMRSAYNFLNDMKGKTRAQVGILGFTDQVRLLSGLTTDYVKAAKTIYIEDTGGTSLNDAIITASNMLAGQKGKKSILLQTDGEDSGSGSSIEEAIQSAKKHNISIYLLGFGNANVAVLQRIANDTGGKFYFAKEAGDLSELYTTMVSEQDYIYTLEYEMSMSDPTQPNHLAFRITQDRSNEADISYDPLSSTLLKSWWDKAKDFVHDMKGDE